MKVRELITKLLNEFDSLDCEVKIKIGDEGTSVPIESVEEDDDGNVVIADTNS